MRRLRYELGGVWASAIEDAVSSQALSQLIGLAYGRTLISIGEQALGETTNV
jgi:hypothetical protein